MLRWDSNGQPISYSYYEAEAGRRTAANLLARDEARRIAANIAKLPNMKPGEKELTEWLLAAYVVRRSCQNPDVFDELVAEQDTRLRAMQNPVFTYRKAAPIEDDQDPDQIKEAEGVWIVFEEVASEIPVPLTAEDKQNRALIIIGECINSNESWVAVDAAGTIVGFALARRDPHELTALALEYIGVSKNSRGHEISPALVDKLKAKGVPLTAAVLHANQSGMVNRLVDMGFTKGLADAKQTKLRWDPPPVAEPSTR